MSIQQTIDVVTRRAKRKVSDYRDHVEGEMGKTDDAVKSSGQTFKKWLGGIAVAAATAVAAALFRASSKAIQFQEAMVQVQKTTGVTDEELQDIGDNLLDLSGRLGVGQQKLARIAETAGQLGIQGTENITTFTETVAKMVATTELSAEQAASQIAQISNAFDLPITQAEQLGSVINELSNTTTARASDIVEALSRVGGAGRSVGLTTDQVAALGATLVDTGIRSRRAGTQLRNVLLRLQTRSADLADQMGITQEEFSAMIEDDALGALQAYLDHIRELPKQLAAAEIEQVFGQENFLAVQNLANATGILNENLATSNEAFRQGESLQREFAASLDSVASQATRLLAKFDAWATETAQSVLQATESMLRSLNAFFASAEETAEAVERLRQENEQLGEVDEAISVFQRLSDKQNLTERQSRKLREATRLLQQQYPGYVKATNDAGRATDFYAGALRQAVQQQRALNRAQQQAKIGSLAEQFAEASREARNARTNQQGFREALRQARRETRGEDRDFGIGNILPDRTRGAQPGVIRDRLEEAGQTAAQAEAKARDAARALGALFRTPEGIDRQALVDALVGTGESLEEARTQADRLIRKWEQLNQVQQEATGDGSGDGSGTPGTGGGGTTDSDELGDALDRLKQIKRENRLNAAQTERERQALQNIFELKDKIRQTTSDIKKLSGENKRNAQDQLDTLKERLQTQGSILSQELRRQGRARAEEGLQTFGPADMQELPVKNIHDATQGLGRLIERFRQGRIEGVGFAVQVRQAVQDLNIEMARTLIEWVKQADISKEAQETIISLLEQRIKKLKEARGEQEESTSEAIRFGNTLQDLAASVRALGRLADVFGDISDETRQAIDGTVDLLDNVGRMVELSDELEGGLFGSFGNVAQGLPSIVGAGAGLVSVIGGLISSTDENTEAIEENKKELQEHRAALMEAKRGFEQAAERLLSQEQIGADLTLERINELLDTEADLGGEAGRRQAGIGGQMSRAQIIDRLRLFEEAGVAEGLVDTFKRFLERGFPIGDALAQTLENSELRQTLLRLRQRFGEFGDSVAGLQAQVRLMEQIGRSDEQIFQAIRDDFGRAGLSDALIEAIGAAFEEGKSVQKLLRKILLGEGPISIGETGLTRNELQNLISVFGFQGGGRGGSEAATRGVGIDRTITEASATQLLQLQEEQVFYLKRIAARLGASGISAGTTSGAMIGPDWPPMPQNFRERQTVGGTLNVEHMEVSTRRQGFSEDEVRELSTEFAQLVRDV